MNFFEFYNQIKNQKFPKLKLTWETNKENFSSFLMSEATKGLVNDISNWAEKNPDEIPFDDLFSKQKEAEEYPDDHIYRTIIPFQTDPHASSILKKIEDSNLKIDFSNGLISDEKKQQKLGKFVLNKINPFTKEPSFITEDEKRWWIHSGNPLEQLMLTKNKNQYEIIVSRSPIDVVRMSDHDGWTSCHAPTGDYFQCAVADAKGAGAVAYVVRKDDLKNINLQDDEVFADKQRNIEGIKPLSRVRLRKFVHKKDDYQFAVPEDRTYGKIFPGLQDSVRKWAMTQQEDVLKGKRPKMKDFWLMGGSYQDTKAGHLFNHMFGDNEDPSYEDADYGGEDEYGGMLHQYEEEVSEIERDYRNKFNFCSFYSEVDNMEGHPYVSYGGSISLEIPKELMLPKPSGPEPEGTSYNQTRDYKFREKLRAWARKNDIYAQEIEVDDEVFRFDIQDDSYDNNTPDAFRSFLQHTLKPLDESGKELQLSLYNFLVENRRAKPNKVTQMKKDYEYSQSIGDEDDSRNFKNFNWEEEDAEITLQLTNPIQMQSTRVNTPGRFAGSYWYNSGYWTDIFKAEFSKELEKWANQIVKYQNQPTLFPIDNIKKPFFSQEFKIKPTVEIKSASNSISNPSAPANIQMKLEFQPFEKDEHVEDAVALVEYLDKNYQKFVELVQKVFGKIDAEWVKTNAKNNAAREAEAASAASQTDQKPHDPNSYIDSANRK